MVNVLGRSVPYLGDVSRANCAIKFAVGLWGLPNGINLSTRLECVCVCLRGKDLRWRAQFRWDFRLNLFFLLDICIWCLPKWIAPCKFCRMNSIIYLHLAVCIFCVPNWIAPFAVHSYIVRVCAHIWLNHAKFNEFEDVSSTCKYLVNSKKINCYLPKISKK